MPKKEDGVLTDVDWSRGMVRDLPRTAMPAGSVYDSVDYILKEAGLAYKRGGTSYYGPVASGASYLETAVYTEFPSATSLFLDSSAGAHTVSAFGDAKVDSAQSKFGGASAKFDGTGDYLSVNDSADWNFAGGNWTIDFWVRFGSVGSAQCLIEQGANTTSDRCFRIDFANPGLRHRFSSDGAAYAEDNTETWAPSANTWYHVAIVRNGSNIMSFVGGVQVGSTRTYAGTMHDSASPLLIGQDGSAAAFVNGWIDELRVSKGLARWTAGFTPPSAAYTPDGNTQLLLHADASVTVPAQTLILATGSDGHLYQVTPSTTTDLGSVGANRQRPFCKPVLHISGTSRVVFPASDGTSGPYAYDGTSLAALPGSPPAGRIQAVHKARLVLANSSGNSNRIWFSPLDLSSTWDTATSWIDADHTITGLASLQNVLLVFSSGYTDYITGSVPPPNSDMTMGPLGRIGCIDARSVAIWQTSVIFCNQDGVYLTNGVGFRSLTEAPEVGSVGIGAYWRSLLANYADGWRIVGGVVGNYYIVTIRDSGDTLIDTLMCDLPKRAWVRFSNFNAGAYTTVSGGAQEMYYADRGSAHLVALANIFVPSASNKNDANGNAVAPLIETRFLGTGPLLKAYGFARISYDMRDAGTDNPTMAVYAATNPEATTFNAVPESPLAETADSVRKRVTINKDAQGVTLRLVQSGPSAKTELRAIELEERQYAAVADGVG